MPASETLPHILTVSENVWTLTLSGAAGSNAVTSATTSDGTAALYLDSIRFESSNGGPTQLGEMAWESTDGSIDAQLENGVIAAFAEDGLIRVRNTSGVPIAKGDALRYTGTNGATGRLEVAKWVGANVSNAKTFMGFAACAMNHNSNGYAQWFGKLEGITTTGGGEAWIDGQIIYAVPGTSATITDTAPTAAGEYVVAAAVINAGSGTSGSMFVRPSFAKNIASADIVDASSLGSLSTAGKAALYGAEGELAAAYLFAGENLDYATYFNDRIEVPAVGGAVEMNFPTTGSGTLMLNSNNLSDLTSASTARTNLGLGTASNVQFAAITGTTGSFSSNFTILGYVWPSYIRLTGGTGEVKLYKGTGNGVLTIYNSTETSSLSLDINTLGTLKLRNAANNADYSIALLNLTASGYLQGAEMTAPAAPPANGFRIFAEDNGSGKTRLMVQFATGAAQQIAIEP